MSKPPVARKLDVGHLCVGQLVFCLLVVSSCNYFKMQAWSTSMLLLLHSAFMRSVVKLLLKGEVGVCALSSYGNDIVDNGKSWKNHGIVFWISVGTLLRAHFLQCETWPLTRAILKRSVRAMIRQICSIKPEYVATVRSSKLLAKLELEELDLVLREGRHHCFFLFDLILYVPSTIFQFNRDGSSWVEPVLSKDKCVLLKDHSAVTLVRLEPSVSSQALYH